MCVCMYIHGGRAQECQFVALARNVNLCSRLGPGTHASLDMCITRDVGTTFLGDRGQKGQHSWPFAMYVFAESSA